MKNIITKLGAFETQFEATNLIVIADSSDMPLILSLRKWTVEFDINNVIKNVYSSLGTKKCYLHRLIFNARKEEKIDHKDRNPLNNKRNNLRVATSLQNRVNSKKRVGVSKLKGVCFDYSNLSNSWRASIRIDGVLKHLGFFSTEEEAGLAYDKAARNAFGEFANLNFKD